MFFRTHQYHLQGAFKHVLHRDPVPTRAVDRHTRTTFLQQPLLQFLQGWHRRPKRAWLDLCLLVNRTHPDGYRQPAFANVDSCTSFPYGCNSDPCSHPLCLQRAAGVYFNTLPLRLISAIPGSMSASRASLIDRLLHHIIDRSRLASKLHYPKSKTCAYASLTPIFMYAGDDPAMLCLIGTITGSSRSASPSLGFRSIVGALSTIDGYEATR